VDYLVGEEGENPIPLKRKSYLSQLLSLSCFLWPLVRILINGELLRKSMKRNIMEWTETNWDNLLPTDFRSIRNSIAGRQRAIY
jgi:hypothetical protein